MQKLAWADEATLVEMVKTMAGCGIRDTGHTQERYREICGGNQKTFSRLLNRKILKTLGQNLSAVTPCQLTFILVCFFSSTGGLWVICLTYAI